MGIDNTFDVTVFVATTGELKRKERLKSAIQSVLSQKDSKAKLIVLINGQEYDKSLRAKLMQSNEFETFYLELGNYPEALKYARSIVETKFFCFLDDDDEFTAGSIQKRLEKFTDDDAIDVVVGNGFRRNQKNVQQTVLSDAQLQFCKQKLLQSLFRDKGNWLASCAGMYRTSAIPQGFFDDYAKHAEWSYLALKLALYKRVTFVEEPCFIINDSDDSLSKSTEYFVDQYRYLLKLLKIDLPAQIIETIQHKKTEMEHQLSTIYLDKKQHKPAWRYHLASLASWYGLKRYLLFSRRLLLSQFSWK